MSPKIRSVLGGLTALLALAAPAAGQAGWTLRGTDADTTFALGLATSMSGPEAPSAAALDSLHQSGHLRARIDSVARDTVFATVGARAVVRSLGLVGTDALDAGAVRDGWRTAADAPFDGRALAHDVQASAARYAAEGYADARVTPDVRVTDDGRAVEIVVRVDEGRPSLVAGVELVGGRASARSFASRIAGVAPGTPARDVDLEQIRQSLDATGLYAAVGEPVIARDASGALVVQVPVAEAPPGTFDVVLGFLPPSAGTAAQVVGSGRVDLRNVLGGGRAVHLELVRNPGLVSTFDVEARDPFVLGSPVGLGLGFEGTSQDSTFSRQRVAVDVAYPIARGLTLLGSLSRRSVRPGTYGADEVDGLPRIRRSDAFYAGAGLSYVAVDAPRSPRRGLALALSVEQGRPRRDVADVAVSSVQRRLAAELRAYVPTLRRQGIVLGLDAALVRDGAGLATVLDESDLFRIGGARSLRGYDENAFLGQTVGRVFGEYRLHLDAQTFAFAFGDLGYVDRPALAGLAALRRVLPGYGVGVQLQTGLGLASISYALNPDLPVGRGKVHVGLAVGL